MALLVPAESDMVMCGHNIILASTRKNLSSGSANNKGGDQPAHLRRLISAFVICFLENILSKLATNEISIF